MVPIAVMIVFSFNVAPNGRVALKWLGFTTAAYRDAFGIQDLTGALINSLVVAVGSALISVILGTPLALGAYALQVPRQDRDGHRHLRGYCRTCRSRSGASLLSLFLELNIPRGLVTIIISHVSFNVAFAVVVIRARMTRP